MVPSPPSTTARSVPLPLPRTPLRPFPAPDRASRSPLAASGPRRPPRRQARRPAAAPRRCPPGRLWLKTVMARGFKAPPCAPPHRGPSCAPARPASASHTKLSRLPAGPGSPEEANPSTDAPACSRTSAATATSAARRSSAERTTPPLPTRSRPTSNCGLTRARQSKRGAAQRSTAGSTFVSDMKATSTTIRSGSNGQLTGLHVAGVAALDHRHAARPGAATSAAHRRRRRSATTASAPRCSRQSVKPPVEAPTSSARRPAGSTPKASRALASLIPPRETNAGLSATWSVGVVGHHLARLAGRALAHVDVPRHHSRGRARAALVEAALGEERVEALLRHSRRLGNPRAREEFST